MPFDPPQPQQIATTTPATIATPRRNAIRRLCPRTVVVFIFISKSNESVVAIAMKVVIVMLKYSVSTTFAPLSNVSRQISPESTVIRLGAVIFYPFFPSVEPGAGPDPMSSENAYRNGNVYDLRSLSCTFRAYN